MIDVSDGAALEVVAWVALNGLPPERLASDRPTHSEIHDAIAAVAGIDRPPLRDMGPNAQFHAEAHALEEAAARRVCPHAPAAPVMASPGFGEGHAEHTVWICRALAHRIISDEWLT